MTTLNWQVTSLELSKKLKTLGVKQESLFYYWATEIEQDGIAWWNVSEKEPRKGKPVRAYLDSVGRPSMLSAYTVAELGEKLWNIFEKAGWNLIYKVYGEVFGFKGTQFIGELGIINLMRKPDMGAKMLIYLLEQNIIKAEDL